MPFLGMGLPAMLAAMDAPSNQRLSVIVEVRFERVGRCDRRAFARFFN